MVTENLDLKPVQRLLARHAEHNSPYRQEFGGINLVIYPDVFNPAYTTVSGLLHKNLSINPGDRVLDMFCGSGVLGLSVAKLAEKIVGVDIAPVAVKCATENASANGFSGKTEFRCGNVWSAVNDGEVFDLIIANPPLLPAYPESVLEAAVADSPEMNITTRFINGCGKYLSKKGKVLMAFSDASRVVFDNPLDHVRNLSGKAGLSMSIKTEKDVGYEVYRVLEFRRNI